MNTYLPEGKLLDTAENISALSSVSGIEKAMKNNTVLESKAVLCDSAHNLIVDMGICKGLIPREEGALGIREGAVRDIAILSRVNRCVQYTVEEISFDKDGGVIPLLSRAKAQKKCVDEYISKLIPGDVIPAKITRLEPFGAFCDIGAGVAALMPIDTISVSRIEHPAERFRDSMDIKAVVKLREGARVTLSHKELLGTWEENASRFSAGSTVTGVIRSVENYGAFVELAPNLAGLSELKEGLRVGDRASVYIKSIIPSKMKIKLVIIETFPPDKEISPLRYYISSGHIDRFDYSPEGCEKNISTVFDDRY